MPRGDLTLGLPWVKLPTTFDGDFRLKDYAVSGLYAHALAYCGQHLTDGHIPSSFVPKAARKLADQLVKDGLWDPEDSGWFIPGYLDSQRQQSRQETEERRAEARERQRKHREMSQRDSVSSHGVTSPMSQRDTEPGHGVTEAMSRVTSPSPSISPSKSPSGRVPSERRIQHVEGSPSLDDGFGVRGRLSPEEMRAEYEWWANGVVPAGMTAEQAREKYGPTLEGKAGAKGDRRW